MFVSLRGRLDRTTVQVGFFILAFLGFLFLGDQLGATTPSKHIRTDVNFAWPTAEIAVMGPEGAVNILYKREIETAEDPAAQRAKRVEEFKEKFANPYVAASRGFIDEVIRPRQTRVKLIAALARLETKRDKNPPKKHGNIPL